ncbi:MAG: TIGR04206 family protein [Halolamina sp.]
MTRRVTLLALFAPLALPWSVQLFAVGDVTFLFPWALVNTNPLQATTIWAFLFRFTAGLPRFILMWPVSVLVYLLGLGSAALAAVGLEDRRVTAGSVALAGVAQLWVAQGFSVQPGRIAVPTGTVLLAGAAVWYWRRTPSEA